MMLLRGAAAAVVSVHLLLLALLFPAVGQESNITKILSKFPEFTTFNNLLTQTNLAGNINNRQTITVCAVDDAGMKDLFSGNYSNDVIRNVLGLHILLDYFDSDKLHNLTNGTALTATVYQTSGVAPGTSGIVNITDLKDGKVIFAPKDHLTVTATYVKSLKEIPFNLSVIQISNPLLPPQTLAPPSPVPVPTPSPAPAPAPTPRTPVPRKWNFTALMSSNSCSVFAETLFGNTPAYNSFAGSVEDGLTIFCPVDNSMQKIVPNYLNMSAADRNSLLQYHATPLYQSANTLRSANSAMSTLATNGDGTYEFTVGNDGVDVSISTGIVTGKVVSVVKDEQPLAIYAIDNALLPKELFKSAPAPAPGPSPPTNSSPAPPQDTPADGPQTDGADNTPNRNGAVKFSVGKLASLILSLLLMVLII